MDIILETDILNLYNQLFKLASNAEGSYVKSCR